MLPLFRLLNMDPSPHNSQPPMSPRPAISDPEGEPSVTEAIGFIPFSRHYSLPTQTALAHTRGELAVVALIRSLDKRRREEGGG